MVVGVGRRVELGKSLEEEASGGAGTVHFVAADLSTASECHRAVTAGIERFGRVDALINNAGGTGDPPVQDACKISPEAWHAVFRLNVDSTMFCSQRAIEDMRLRRQGGSIVNIASTQAVEVVGGMSAYNSAKAAVVQLGRSLAVECLSDKIRVNSILMGGAATEASAGVMRTVLDVPPGSPFPVPTMPPPLYAQRISDIAAALALLCSDAAKLITGATIAMDRGMSAGSLFSEALSHAYAGGWNDVEKVQS
jgi:NAD(P)-dependent dehydrogenase (short-subunit alcohol dehydrogenase family)